MDYTTKLSNNTNPSFNMRDYLIVHESGTKDYYLYLSNKNEKKISNYKFNEDEIVKLYNAIKKTLELENLI